MSTRQRTIRFSLPAQANGLKALHPNTERDFNSFELPFVNQRNPADLFALLLKRQARQVMADVTACPPDTLPAHLASLARLQDIMRFATDHGLVPPAEARLSGMQLAHPSTVMDFLACLDITRQQHRSPSFVHPAQEQFAAIMDRLDLLAGHCANCAAKGGAL